jgi:hypothetical protein
MPDQDQNNNQKQENTEEETIPVKQDDGSIKQVPASEFHEKFGEGDTDDSTQDDGSKQGSVKNEEKSKQGDEDNEENQDEDSKQNEKNESENRQGKDEALSKLKQKLQKKKQERKQKDENQSSQAEAEPESETEDRTKTEETNQKENKDQEAEKEDKPDEQQKRTQSDKQSWDKEDHKSPLADDEPEVTAATKTPSQSDTNTTDDELREVLSNLPFQVAPGLYERTRSLITSRRKGVRNDKQFKKYIQKNKKEGGLGLSDNSAKSFLEIIHDYFNLDSSDYAEKKLKAKQDLQQESKQEDRKSSPEANSNQPESVDSDKSEDKEKSRKEVPEKSELEYDQNGTLRPKMKDVKEPSTNSDENKTQQKEENQDEANDSEQEDKNSLATGPIKELRQLDWKQFRHFSSDPQQAKQRVLKKFDLLHSESFLLFLDARQAWYQNSIFEDYKNLLIDSVNQQKSIKDLLDLKDAKFDFNEFRAIAEINRELT